MKILQWNIWYQEKIDNILSLLQKVDADVVCIQEATLNSDYNPGMNTAEYLAEKLDYHLYYNHAQVRIVDGVDKSFGNAILSKQPSLSSDCKHIQKPGNPNEPVVDYSNEGRLYSEVTFKVDGKNFTVATTHMSYTDKFGETPGKIEETNNLLAILKEKKENFIITGDFNVEPDSYTFIELEKILQHVGPDKYKPTWTTKPFSYNGFEAKTLDWRLDYVFATSDLMVKSAEIVDTDYSDHLPILVEIEI